MKKLISGTAVLCSVVLETLYPGIRYNPVVITSKTNSIVGSFDMSLEKGKVFGTQSSNCHSNPIIYFFAETTIPRLLLIAIL